MKIANPVSSWFVRLGLLLLAGGLASCDRGQAEPPVSAQPVETYFPLPVGTATVQVQVAISDAEMARGLMYRTDLRSHQGMLFVYDKPQVMTFWMRNTPTALDIGFFTSDGVLREVYPLYPFDERSVRSARSDLQYALEVPQGWFETTGVKPGDRLDLQRLAELVEARGFDPERFEGLR